MAFSLMIMASSRFLSLSSASKTTTKDYYKHTYEGPDDMPAHIKASLLGSSVTVPITNGKFNLGMWQGVYLCEHRNHRDHRDHASG